MTKVFKFALFVYRLADIPSRACSYYYDIIHGLFSYFLMLFEVYYFCFGLSRLLFLSFNFFDFFIFFNFSISLKVFMWFLDFNWLFFYLNYLFLNLIDILLYLSQGHILLIFCCSLLPCDMELVLELDFCGLPCLLLLKLLGFVF